MKMLIDLLGSIADIYRISGIAALFSIISDYLFISSVND